jgi:hypothetical protein
MIEQLQSLMKAFEAGSYCAMPQKAKAVKYVWDASANCEIAIADDGSLPVTIGQRMCECPGVDERGIG